MIVDKVRRIQKGRNVHQHLDLIAGLPYGTLKEFRSSFNDVYSLRPQQFQLGFLKVLKGSEMGRRAEEFGVVRTDRPPYEVLSTDWLSYGEVLKIKGIEEQVNEAVRRQEYSVRSRELEQKAPEMKEFSDLVFFNLQSAGSVLSGDNDVQIFTDGNDKFDALIEDIRNAQSYIFLQYYIIKNDLLFNRIRDVLVEKVSEGVEVRILYDAMGCRSVRKSYWKEAEAAGIKTAVFFPALFGQLNLRVNYRNHRKIAVIDGRIGYVGGFNIGKEYIGLDPKFGHWRDTHLRICGSAVGGLLMRYIQDWDYAARENLFADPKYFVTHEETPGSSKIQIVSSGPDCVSQNIRDNYLRLIHKAKKRIYIQTPYFIPDESIQTALLLAAMSGVEVNLMIPCKPDHPFVYWATFSYVGELIMAGANCYTYNNGFLHSKGISIDGEACCYGTANMDIRSFRSILK